MCEVKGVNGLKLQRVFVALVLLGMLVVGALSAGCGGGGGATGGPAVKTQADPGAPEVKVESISRSPMDYDNQTVTTEGNYAVGYCAACFLLKDGVSAVRVEVSDTAPLPPESKLNSRMRVTGKIYVANGSPNLVATGIDYL